MVGETTTSPPTQRRLGRSRTDRVIAGVCGGLGRYFRVDPVFFRIAFVVLAVSGFGGGVLLYLIGWLVLPEIDTEGAEDSTATPAPTSRGGARIVGISLVVVGAIALIDRFLPRFDMMFWPLVLVGLGAALIWRGGHHDDVA